MARPQNNRKVNTPPLFSRFKPIGVKGKDLNSIVLTLDEYEAIRLADLEGLNHEDAAKLMNISRSTFSRLIDKARKKTADFLINGAILEVEGGKIHFTNNLIQCEDCNEYFKTNINIVPTECPFCKSKNLIIITERFGHGNCCRTE